MGRVNQYVLSKTGVGMILKGKTRISCFARSGFSIVEQPYIMSYHSDIILALNSGQYWRSNRMMIDSTSMSRTCADYTFPKEGALIYFYLDQFSEPPRDTIIEIHTEIGDLGDGF